MPLVYRAMRADGDGLPTVEPTASGLGVRPGIDVDVVAGDVLKNGLGMSVSPSWRVISILRVPKRLRDKVPGARGSNSTYCFKYGVGPFAAGLELAPDTPAHGCVTPGQQVPLLTHENDLASTRADWQVDEN